MRSFYLRFHVYAIEKLPFFWNLSSNLWYNITEFNKTDQSMLETTQDISCDIFSTKRGIEQ